MVMRATVIFLFNNVENEEKWKAISWREELPMLSLVPIQQMTILSVPGKDKTHHA